MPAGSTLVQWWAVTPVAPRALWCRCHVPHTTRCPAPPPAVPDWRDIRVGRRVNMYDGPDLAPHGDNVGGFEMRRIFFYPAPIPVHLCDQAEREVVGVGTFENPQFLLTAALSQNGQIAV